MVRFRASAGKSNKTVSTSWSFTGDRWFESCSLQRRVQCEPDADDFLAAGGTVLAEPLADRAQHEMPAQPVLCRPVVIRRFLPHAELFSIGLCMTQQEHDRPARGVPALSSSRRGEPATFEGRCRRD